MSRILVVDDEDVNVKIIKNILKEVEGCEVQTASNGTEALNIAPDFHPDIILLDIMMPDLSGYDVCKQIRKNEELKFTKTIMVSAKAMIEERVKGYSAGADDYITKPFDDEELLSKLRVFLRLKYSDEVNEMKNNLLKLVSNELRLPLNGILGFANMLLENQNLTSNEKDYVEKIITSGEKLIKFSQKAMLLYDLTSGMELSFLKYSLKDIIENILRNQQSIIFEKNIRVNLQHGIMDLTTIDPFLIENAVSFIVDNAIKFSPSDAVVSIETKREDGKNYVIVSDQGKGVNAKDKELIFVDFIKREINRNDTSQGLSMAIAKKIAILHGGDINISDNIDGGATFTLSFSSRN